MSMKQNDETQSRWYMVNKDGMVTLCADQADAEQVAKDAQEVWPHMGPHRAGQLSESFGAWFTAADMATASAQGFRDGQAAELAAMLAGGEPVAWAWNHSRVKEVGPVYMPHPEKSPYLESINATGPIPLYAHPQPAAQDAELYQFIRNCSMEDRNKLEHYSKDALDKAIRAAIAAQQGEKT